MRHRKGSFGLLLLAVAMAGAGACSNQGEGQRCDKNSGDSDCATGLVCTTIQSTTSGGSAGAPQGQLPAAVCCPPPGQSATTQACSAVTSIFDAGTVPADAGSKGGAGGASTGGEGGASTGGKADASAAGATHLDASTEAGR